MLTKTFFKALLVAASVSGVYAHPQRKNTDGTSERVQSGGGGGRQAPPSVATKVATGKSDLRPKLRTLTTDLLQLMERP